MNKGVLNLAALFAVACAMTVGCSDDDSLPSGSSGSSGKGGASGAAGKGGASGAAGKAKS